MKMDKVDISFWPQCVDFKWIPLYMFLITHKSFPSTFNCMIFAIKCLFLYFQSSLSYSLKYLDSIEMTKHNSRNRYNSSVDLTHFTYNQTIFKISGTVKVSIELFKFNVNSSNIYGVGKTLSYIFPNGRRMSCHITKQFTHLPVLPESGAFILFFPTHSNHLSFVSGSMDGRIIPRVPLSHF